MSKWVRAKARMQQTKLREATEKLFIDYIPKIGCVNLTSKLTGGNKGQEVKTEYDLGWHITVLNGKLFLISHKATSFRITLYGKIGWENSENILQKICRDCYSDTELDIVADYLTTEEFAQLSGYLQKTDEKMYCLGSKKKSAYRLFVRCVIHGKIERRTLYYDKEDTKVELICSVRPRIELPDNVLLLTGDKEFDGSTPQKAIKIRFKGDNKQDRIEELKKEIQETEQHLKELKEELDRLTC